MKPLFCDELEIGGIMPLAALEKLRRAGICTYDVQKLGVSRLKLYVRAKETQKVFAILRGSCYTVTKTGSARGKRAADALLRRPGLLAGALLFCAAACFGNACVLRIDVVGSAARYRERALEILRSAGVGVFSLYDENAAERAQTAMLALPGVVFASLDKSGCVLKVTLEESADAPAPMQAQSLVATRAGVVEEITALRGTPLVGAGERVEAGQTLVGGYFLTESGEQRETAAIARCSLLCDFAAEYASGEDTAEARSRAEAQALLEAGGELVAADTSVRAEGDGFVFTVRLTVRVRLSVNLS